MVNKPTDQDRLEHMIDAIETIFSYTRDLSFETFSLDRMMQDAVVKNFENLGEAAYWISDSFKKAYPEIEWDKAAGIRHVLVHDYYRIDPQILWNTLTEDLPDLLEKLEKLK